MSALRQPRAVSVSTAGYEDGLGRRSVRFDREIGGMLECLQLRPELWAFEATLRQRAEAIGRLEDERFVRVRDIERGSPGLTVVSELVPGGRLIDILEARQIDDSAAFGIDAALGFLLRVLPALSTLHSTGIAHGALAPGRIVVTPAAQIVLLDGIYGSALERLNLSRAALWNSLGVLSLPFAGASRFDRRSDVMQAALCAVTLALGRQIDEAPTQGSLSGLVREVTELAQIRAGARFSQGVLEFLTATLPVTGRAPDMATDDAVTFVERLASLIGEDEAHAAFEALTRYESNPEKALTFETDDDAFDDDKEEILDLEADPESSSLDEEVDDVVTDDDEDEDEALAEEPEPAPLVVTPPAPAIPAAPVQQAPAPTVAAAPPAPVVAPPAPSVTPLTPVVPAAQSSPATPPYMAPVPPSPPVVAPPIAVAPPPIAPVGPAPVHVPPPPAVPVQTTPPGAIPVAPSIAASSALPIINPPVVAPPSPPPIAITVAPPSPVRVRPEPPAGYTPAAVPDAAPPVRALPFVDRAAPEEPAKFPWKIAAAAVVVLAVAGVAGWTFYPDRPEAKRTEAIAIEETPPAAIPAPTTGKVGMLSIESQPAGAKVLLDGKEVGVTPLTLEAVQPGRRTITITNGTATIRRIVRIEAGRTASLDVPIYSGWVAVFSPIPLDIATGGTTIGNTDTGKIMLPPGKHVLTLSNREFGYTESRTVEIYPGEERPVNVEPKGRVNINAHPWAEVLIDGKKAGDTPIANLPVLLGTRVFTFRHPQYGERRITQTITTAGAALSVDLTKN